jgi:hypothetical protein
MVSDAFGECYFPIAEGEIYGSLPIGDHVSPANMGGSFKALAFGAVDRAGNAGLGDLRNV